MKPCKFTFDDMPAFDGKRLLLATAAILALTATAVATEPTTKMKYPNWFAYRIASGEYSDEHRSKEYAHERPLPYFACDYTSRTCVDGKAFYSGTAPWLRQTRPIMEGFIGVVVDGNDRKTILKHIICQGNFTRCEDYDNGINIKGQNVTVPDMPASCVEEMRKNGVRCKGYSSSLGFHEDANGHTID
jgi:hypothetical protein